VRAVANASPLIYLSKKGALHLLSILYSTVLIPRAVYREVVVKWLEKGFEDAAKVEEAVRKRMLTVREAPVRLVDSIASMAPGLDRGEAEVLALAYQMRGCHVLVDDRLARRAACRLGLEPHGTIYVIASAARRRIISVEDALKLLDELVQSGFRISVKLYLKARKSIQELSTQPR